MQVEHLALELLIRGMELDVVTIMCIAAANYLIARTNEYNEGKDFREKIRMSGKRLQKLLYFSDIEYMKRYNSPMLNDEFYAWPSGPVIPSVYTRFIQYQSGEMRPAEGVHTPLKQEEREILDLIFNNTINVDTSKLVKASHTEGGPWDCVYNEYDKDHKQIISKDKMREFYENMNVRQMLQV